MKEKKNDGEKIEKVRIKTFFVTFRFFSKLLELFSLFRSWDTLNARVTDFLIRLLLSRAGEPAEGGKIET